MPTDQLPINIDAVRQAPIMSDPYTYVTGYGILNEGAADELRRDFPNITKPGFLTVDEVELKGSFKKLIDQLESKEFADALSEKLGLNLDAHPRLTTIRKISQGKDGRIHTDSEAKLATFLVYLNDAWEDSSEGRLRVLRGSEDFDDMVAEIPPTVGHFFGFRRADNSWHGHKPFAGERKVVQITWVQDESELERKKNRNSMAQKLKGIFGR
ncbi:2OG-Fe(II) oxygenase superfamily protein [Faunimonas pinastri]|uniref:2OG-Fe(II) oxygenase superfamily protein n=1 Tax=Faunimonas pinastri TaxID=1855383 RepID=A0A1H9HPY9_9HYPH|nr:2OG-Fe(II) oxygenase [Faunimonas pinastri]SEQ64399.1 2OG-Fe(II) oxygenase superfamily protein [Faunimonas pinastri]